MLVIAIEDKGLGLLTTQGIVVQSGGRNYHPRFAVSAACPVGGRQARHPRNELSVSNAISPKNLGSSEELYRSLIHSTAGGVVVQQADGSAFPGEEHPATVTLRTGQPQRNVHTGPHTPDGKMSWILINTEPVHSQDRRHSVVTTFTEITELQNAEAALRDSERDLREAQHSAKISSWASNTETGAVRWSAELYRIFGSDPGLPAVGPHAGQSAPVMLTNA